MGGFVCVPTSPLQATSVVQASANGQFHAELGVMPVPLVGEPHAGMAMQPPAMGSQELVAHEAQPPLDEGDHVHVPVAPAEDAEPHIKRQRLDDDELMALAA